MSVHTLGIHVSFMLPSALWKTFLQPNLTTNPVRIFSKVSPSEFNDPHS